MEGGEEKGEKGRGRREAGEGKGERRRGEGKRGRREGGEGKGEEGKGGEGKGGREGGEGKGKKGRGRREGGEGKGEKGRGKKGRGKKGRGKKGRGAKGRGRREIVNNTFLRANIGISMRLAVFRVKPIFSWFYDITKTKLYTETLYRKINVKLSHRIVRVCLQHFLVATTTALYATALVGEWG